MWLGMAGSWMPRGRREGPKWGGGGARSWVTSRREGVKAPPHSGRRLLPVLDHSYLLRPQHIEVLSRGRARRELVQLLQDDVKLGLPHLHT